jgi:hypothetical protein
MNYRSYPQMYSTFRTHRHLESRNAPQRGNAKYTASEDGEWVKKGIDNHYFGL